MESEPSFQLTYINYYSVITFDMVVSLELSLAVNVW